MNLTITNNRSQARERRPDYEAFVCLIKHRIQVPRQENASDDHLFQILRPLNTIVFFSSKLQLNLG